MCGLVGYVTSEPVKGAYDKKKFFKQALFADTFRGDDSTGMCLVSADDTALVYKRALAGYDFVLGNAYDSMLRRTSPKIAIGHNRAATKGAISNDTAHPFTWGNIVLAHNGTLTNHRQLKDGDKFVVDSEYIAYAFNKFGVEDTLAKIRGAFALTWYDRETKLFNVVRNSERTLYYAKNTEKNTLMYASEGQMLAWIAGRNDLPIDDNTFTPFEVGKHYTIDPATLEIESKEVEFAPKHYTPSQGGYQGRGSTAGSGTSTPPKTTNAQSKTFLKNLEEIGLEMGETVYMRYIDSDEKFSYFNLGEWYTIPKASSVKVKSFNTKRDYVEKHKNEIFSATVRGCKKVNNEYTVYIHSLLSEGEEFHEKKPEPQPKGRLLRGPANQRITLEEWDKLTAHGCCNCTGPIHTTEDEWIRWTHDGQPVCVDCLMSFYMDQSKGNLAGRLEDA